MACYRPLTAFQCAGGEIVFSERARFDVVRQLLLPCGRCVGCRVERARQWTVRIMHEASQHRDNAFVTLTYDQAHVPDTGSLRYEDFQRFLKRLRHRPYGRKARFFMCGEYGPQLLRPHYHACLFGVRFPDLMRWSGSADMPLWRSAELEQIWPDGFSLVGKLDWKSAAYVARYCIQKVTGSGAEAHYGCLSPEFCHMSLKPGIGARWFERFAGDVYPHDFVVVQGKEAKPPRYYDQLLKRRDPDVFEAVQYSREVRAREMYLDNSPSRVAAKEEVAAARISMKQRHAAFSFGAL